MDKVRRTERVAALTKLLADNPGRLFSLNYFGQVFDLAKSTLSEDMVTIKNALRQYNLGRLETVSGAAGGVRFWPVRAGAEEEKLISVLARRLTEPERIIPGGFLYMTDLLFEPELMVQVGEVFMTRFSSTRPDCLMTIETKGIPMAFMTARALGLPLAIVRQGSKVTEGPAVSINYVSGSSQRIQTMSLPRRAIPAGARVLIIDDFMKAGGTARGMAELAREVGAEVVGTGVLVATAEPGEKLVQDYLPLLILHSIDQQARRIDIRPARLPAGK